MDIGESSRSVRVGQGIAATIGVVTLLVSPLIAAPAHAGETFTVDDDGAQCGAGSYPTIASALDAALDGDTITVCPGLYSERLEVTESVRIVGPVEAVRDFDCFGEEPAAAGDLDTSRFAVLTPPPPVTTEASDPVVTLDADGVELAGLVVQGVIDETAGTVNGLPVYVPSIASTDVHSGYWIHHNLIRSNTLAVEFGSNGEAASRLDHNCVRENRFGVVNQRLGLVNATIESNELYRQEIIGFEIGFRLRSAESIAVLENTIKETSRHGIWVENTDDVRVSENRVVAAAGRSINISAGNTNTEVSDNFVEGGETAFGTGVGIFTTGLVPGLSPSTDVVIRDNTVSGIPVGYGIGIGNASVDGAQVLDNVTTGNGLAGIAVFSNTRNVLIKDNESNDNGSWGIRVQATGQIGVVLEDNRMAGNGLFDASDADLNPADGIQLLGKWVDNICETDQPAGVICGVE